MAVNYSEKLIEVLNEDIQEFPQVYPVEDGMKTTFDGVSRLIMLDRYSYKDTEKKTLSEGDLVVLTVKPDPNFPARGVGYVKTVIDGEVSVELEEQYAAQAGSDEVLVPISSVDKPLELFYEQIAKRVARGLSEVEAEEKQAEVFAEFYRELSEQNFVPAGRVLYGAGANTDVTYFNCLAGDTIVQTRDGSVPIKELSGEVDVLSMDGKYRKAEFKSYGIQELYEVELANGERVKATAGHEWFYNSPKSGLKKTTTLNLKGKNIPLVRKSKKLNMEEIHEGIKHGIVYGDGTVQKGNANVKLFGNKVELVRYFHGEHIAPHYKGDYVGVYKLPKELKQLPDDYVSESYWHGFIVGLIATDGFVDERGSFGFHSSDLSELEKIAENLHKTNFSHLSIKEVRKDSPFTGEPAPNYKVQLAKKSADTTDFIRTAHAMNFEKSGVSNRNPSIKVVAVRPLGYSEEVFCCEEPETNSFVIGTGFLTSNCYVMPMPKDSREGIGEHRNEVMEIMSRGGGK